MTENPASTSAYDPDAICASCFRRRSWCQSTQVQRMEPHEFHAPSPNWTPSDAAGLDGRPNGIHRRQIREALSKANLKNQGDVDAQTGEDVGPSEAI